MVRLIDSIMSLIPDCWYFPDVSGKASSSGIPMMSRSLEKAIAAWALFSAMTVKFGSSGATTI
jgi:hypothetical protein